MQRLPSVGLATLPLLSAGVVHMWTIAFISPMGLYGDTYTLKGVHCSVTFLPVSEGIVHSLKPPRFLTDLLTGIDDSLP